MAAKKKTELEELEETKVTEIAEETADTTGETEEKTETKPAKKAAAKKKPAKKTATAKKTAGKKGKEAKAEPETEKPAEAEAPEAKAPKMVDVLSITQVGGSVNVTASIEPAAEPQEKPVSRKAPKAKEEPAKKPRKTRAKAEKSQERHGVLLINPDDSQRLSEHEAAIMDLVQSAQYHIPLTGKLSGVETVDDHYVGVLFHHDIKVIIPAEMFIRPDDIHKRDDVTLREFYGTSLRYRLGAEIDYTVTKFDEESGVAVASRLDAMDTRIRRFWNGVDREGNKWIYPGALCEARVVSVHNYSVIVEVFGREIQIPLGELAYKYTNSAKLDFKNGERVVVRILTIEQEKGRVNVTASIKQARENPMKEACKRYVEGNTYVGTVTNVTGNGVFVALGDEVTCLAKPPMTERVYAGATVSVFITNISEKTHRISGYVSHIL